MTPEHSQRTLQDEVRRLRAGMVKDPPSTRDPRESEMVRIVSAAALAWEGQLDRVDRFSQPLLPSRTLMQERANPAMTSQLFLAQMASDYRRVASCSTDLREVEARRNTQEGATALQRAGVVSRPVAPLAVGQYLAAYERGGEGDLTRAVEPWVLPAADVESQYAAVFGDVLGPLIEAALRNSRTDNPMALPGWSGRVGTLWCEEFLAAGAEILNWPPLLTRAHIERQSVRALRQGSVNVTQITNEVVTLAETFRPVVDVRVGAAGNMPKIDLVLSGDALTTDEFDRFTTSVQNVPAQVTILTS
ncbi:hypothetical protein KQR54_31115 [Mycobacterium gordonae]|jgi:hypothetical protein|uniref:hypothetical protein n=1 Tax=Mycobacterium TaxID=1763 RepID=UPI001DC99A54|nr:MULTISPECIES: hypothetical protein [Mycobacterium]MBI2702914.1 hypothetical protein [Mycobacterium sp.]MCQ4365515.1 hypothetical protein [Mycobacterium gordonae]